MPSGWRFPGIKSYRPSDHQLWPEAWSYGLTEERYGVKLFLNIHILHQNVILIQGRVLYIVMKAVQNSAEVEDDRRK